MKAKRAKKKIRRVFNIYNLLIVRMYYSSRSITIYGI